MSTQILATKLYIPPYRPTAVLRPRLTQQLYWSLQGKFTLVSAPAGFGKTTLISEWINQVDHPVVWLSLDEEDSNPSRFLAYFVAAIQTMQPDFGETLSGVLNSPQPPPIDSLLTSLLNEIATIPHKFVFVLDDYHALDNQAIDTALAFLVDNQPPQMHLVMTTRSETAASSQASGNTMVTVAALTSLGQLQEADNQFNLAQQTYQRVLELVGDPPWPAACEASLGLGRIHYAANELHQAEAYVQQSLTLSLQIENVVTPIECCLVLARIQMERGDLDAAGTTLLEAERLIEQRGFTDKREFCAQHKLVFKPYKGVIKDTLANLLSNR